MFSSMIICLILVVFLALKQGHANITTDNVLTTADNLTINNGNTTEKLNPKAIKLSITFTTETSEASKITEKPNDIQIATKEPDVCLGRLRGLGTSISTPSGTSIIYVNLSSAEWILYLGCKDFNFTAERKRMPSQILNLTYSPPVDIHQCIKNCTAFAAPYPYIGLNDDCFCFNDLLTTPSSSNERSCSKSGNTYFGRNKQEIAFYLREPKRKFLCYVFQKKTHIDEERNVTRCKKLPYLESSIEDRRIITFKVRTMDWAFAQSTCYDIVNRNLTEGKILDSENTLFLLAVYNMEYIRSAGNIYPMENLSLFLNRTKCFLSCEQTSFLPFCSKYQCIIMGASAGGAFVVLLVVAVCCVYRSRKAAIKYTSQEIAINMEPIDIYSMAVPITNTENCTGPGVTLQDTFCDRSTPKVLYSNASTIKTPTGNEAFIKNISQEIGDNMEPLQSAGLLNLYSMVVPVTDKGSYISQDLTLKDTFCDSSTPNVLYSTASRITTDTEYNELSRDKENELTKTRTEMTETENAYNSLNHTLVSDSEVKNFYDRVKPTVKSLVGEDSKRFVGTEYDSIEILKN